jgi:hypothetical protein
LRAVVPAILLQDAVPASSGDAGGDGGAAEPSGDGGGEKGTATAAAAAGGDAAGGSGGGAAAEKEKEKDKDKEKEKEKEKEKDRSVAEDKAALDAILARLNSCVTRWVRGLGSCAALASCNEASQMGSDTTF